MAFTDTPKSQKESFKKSGSKGKVVDVKEMNPFPRPAPAPTKPASKIPEF